MPHQVSLSRPAYAALKAQKQEGESFSDVVLRLISETTPVRDPWKGFGRKTIPDPDAYLGEVEAWRDSEVL